MHHRRQSAGHRVEFRGNAARPQALGLASKLCRLLECRCDPHDVAGFAATLERLRDSCPVLRSYHLGADLGTRSQNADFAIVAEFDAVEDWDTYDTHPRHLEVKAMIPSLVADIMIVQSVD